MNQARLFWAFGKRDGTAKKGLAKGEKLKKA